MRNYPQVGMIEVHGEKQPVFCSPTFSLHVEIGDTEVVAADSETLAKRASQEASKQKVSLTIAVIIGPSTSQLMGGQHTRYERATLRGRNVRTGAYLLTLASGEKIALDHPNIVARGEAVTDEELAELNRLRDVAIEAQRAVDAYLPADKRLAGGWGPRQLIDEAMKAAGVETVR